MFNHIGNTSTESKKYQRLYLYIFDLDPTSPEPKYYKLGCTEKLKNRECTHRTTCPWGAIVFSVEVDDRMAESNLFRLLKDYPKNRELFLAPINVIKQKMRLCSLYSDQTINEIQSDVKLLNTVNDP